jgi:predicted Abi (CAAX) family protease
MKISFLPKTVTGKWAVGLAIGFIVLFVLVIILAATGQEGGETFFSNLYLAIPGLLALASGIAAFVTGVISIIFSRERGFLVFLAAVVGLLVIIFMVGDVLFPA